MSQKRKRDKEEELCAVSQDEEFLKYLIDLPAEERLQLFLSFPASELLRFSKKSVVLRESLDVAFWNKLFVADFGLSSGPITTSLDDVERMYYETASSLYFPNSWRAGGFRQIFAILLHDSESPNPDFWPRLAGARDLDRYRNDPSLWTFPLDFVRKYNFDKEIEEVDEDSVEFEKNLPGVYVLDLNVDEPLEGSSFARWAKRTVAFHPSWDDMEITSAQPLYDPDEPAETPGIPPRFDYDAKEMRMRLLLYSNRNEDFSPRSFHPNKARPDLDLSFVVTRPKENEVDRHDRYLVKVPLESTELLPEEELAIEFNVVNDDDLVPMRMCLDMRHTRIPASFVNVANRERIFDVAARQIPPRFENPSMSLLSTPTEAGVDPKKRNLRLVVIEGRSFVVNANSGNRTCYHTQHAETYLRWLTSEKKEASVEMCPFCAVNSSDT